MINITVIKEDNVEHIHIESNVNGISIVNDGEVIDGNVPEIKIENGNLYIKYPDNIDN